MMTNQPSDSVSPERNDSGSEVIGLAISGGGHRATAYALGVLLYLVDTGLNQKIHTVTSVSGGSILNAFIALLRSADGQKVSFKSFGPGEFDKYAAQLASLISGNRLIWFVSIVSSICVTALVMILFFLSVIRPLTTLLLIAAALAAISVFLGPKSGGSLWGWFGTWFYCAVLLWLTTTGIIISRVTDYGLIVISSFVLLIGWLFQQRHWVAERAYEYTVCRPFVKQRRWKTSRAHLEDMNTEVRHVFCATEMHSGQHAYFSHDFVYARGFGVGQPASLPVATALQISANFPGGFPIRPLLASRFQFSLTDRFEDAVEQGIKQGRDILMPDEDAALAIINSKFPSTRPFPKWLMLSDGGVFDNLAADWYLENNQRLARFKMYLNWDFDVHQEHWIDSETNKRDEAILSPFRDTPECIIVVNAGVTAHWQGSSSAIVSFRYRIWVRSLVFHISLQRCTN
jgi:hypothetical protein